MIGSGFIGSITLMSVHDSGVDRFRRQFAHLEEGTAKGEKPSPQLRQNVSLPRFSSKLTLSFP
jgi:hypothetical protein